MTFVPSPVSYGSRCGDKLVPYKAGSSCTKIKEAQTKCHYDIERLNQIAFLIRNNNNNNHYRRRLPSEPTISPNDMLRLSSHPIEENLRHEILSGRISCTARLLASYPPMIPLLPAKKQVSFSTMATVHTNPSSTQAEISSSWYSDKEYAKFELDRQRTLRILHSVHKGNIQSLEETGEYCILGLEKNVSRRSSLQRKYQTMQHSYAVLQQQLMNHKKGIYDVLSIQAVSEQYSKTTAAELAAREYQRYRMLYRQRENGYHDPQVGGDMTNVLDQALTVAL